MINTRNENYLINIKYDIEKPKLVYSAKKKLSIKKLGCQRAENKFEEIWRQLF